MKTTKYLLEAVLLVLGMVVIMTIILGNKPAPQQLPAYEGFKPVVVSGPQNEQVWEDHFDTTYTDDWGIVYKTRK